MADTLKEIIGCPICANTNTPHMHSMKKNGMKQWIGVDFDGTLAYDVLNRTDAYVLGEPIVDMVHRVQSWLAAGWEVRIMTARMCEISYTTGTVRDLLKMERALRNWCMVHIGAELPCTNKKDGLMEVLWDDRAVRVALNTGNPESVHPH